MEHDKSKPQTQQQGTNQQMKESVLTDKDRFGDHGADEKLRHMGEKTRETKEQKK